MSGSTVTMFQHSNATNANNIGASQSWGHKKLQNVFVSSAVGASGSGVSYVSSKTRGTNDVQGDIVNTGVSSDVAIQGQGLLAVSSSASSTSVVYTRRGDFRQDQLGYWENGSGLLLFAWKLDAQGNRPQGSANINSLEAVNFANTKGDPQATTILSIAMNLDANQAPLVGPTITAAINKMGVNSSTLSSDILLPEEVQNGSICIGDTMTFTSLSGGNPTSKTVTYGGLTVANTPSVANQLFGAAKATDVFNFAGGNLQSGNQIKISVNGTVYVFTAVTGTPSADAKTFNSITTLNQAINKITGLQSRISAAGTLYIAPMDPSQSVTFTNGSNSVIKETLGLTDIPAAPLGQFRFNSMSTLQRVANANSSTFSVQATINNNGAVNIGSLLATNDFKIEGSSLGINSFTTATINPGATEAGRATVKISAPGNNLKSGDFVNIKGMGNADLPDGRYEVMASDDNSFSIALMVTSTAFPAANAAPALTPAAGATWQKIPGQQYTQNAGAITASAVGAGGAVTVTFANHGLATNDVVQVKGGTMHVGANDISLPDGYYTVTVTDVNNFTINAANVAATNTYNASTAVDFRKVGTTAAGNITAGITSNLVVTTGGAGKNQVKLFMSNRNYSVGDYISLTGLGNAGALVDGITLMEGTSYKIVAADASSVTFEVIGGVSTTGDGVAGLQDSAALPTLGVNNYSRLFEYLGINQAKSDYVKTYDSNDISKSLSGNNFSSAVVFGQPVQVFDSLGKNFELIFNFAKLDSNLWAVEVSSTKDANGEYEIQGVTADGKLCAGTLQFDAAGKLISSPGLTDPLQILRSNGSAPSSITIDWQNALSAVTNGTISQLAMPNNVDLIQQNGQAAGTLTSLSVDVNGYIVGTFDSGETRNLYQIPIAMFANVNGLQPGADGTFSATQNSGLVLLKQASVGGAGVTLGGVLESSNADTTEELLNVQELSNVIRANARAVSTEFQNTSVILGELKGA